MGRRGLELTAAFFPGLMVCVHCLVEQSEARLAGAPLCLGCVDRVLAGERLRDLRQCSRCRGPVRGGYDDMVAVCRACVEAELERAMAVELNPSAREWLPPLRESWSPRALRPVELSEDQAREQLAALRARFAVDGVIVPPAPPRRSWLDDA